MKIMIRLTVLLMSIVFLSAGCDNIGGIDGKSRKTSMERIGQSNGVSYVFYTANNGDLYYVNTEDGYLDLMKYELDSGITTTVSDNFVSDYNGSNEGFGMISPTADGDTVYCMTTSGANAEVWRLICSEDNFEYVTGICGTNWWKIFNMTLSQDGNALYFISSNNGPDDKRVYKIDLQVQPITCTAVLDISSVIGPDRDLCFGGINVWDNNSNFYAPVWSYNYDDGDLAILQVHVADDNYQANLIHFTDDGTALGNPLNPDFRHNSCWSGIGAGSNGDVYIAVSNHYQPINKDDIHGNVAIYKYDSDHSQIHLLGDLRSVSTAVGNWMPNESQHKVHTFIMEHANGKMYFATDDYKPSYFIRGAHLYTIDLVNDKITDFSKTQPELMLRDFSVINNKQSPSVTSGVFIEYYGIKGIGLNSHAPNILYVMLYADDDQTGHIIKYIFPDTL